MYIYLYKFLLKFKLKWSWYSQRAECIKSYIFGIITLASEVNYLLFHDWKNCLSLSDDKSNCYFLSQFSKIIKKFPELIIVSSGLSNVNCKGEV